MEKRLGELSDEYVRLQKQLEHAQHQHQRLQNRKNYYESGEVSDFTRKGGVVFSDILLPPHAPTEL